MLAPFMSHAALSPVTELRHTRSALPSPLRSPTAPTCHSAPTMLPVAAVLPMLEPFINHIWFSPVPEWRQRTSAFPSPSRSWLTGADKGVGVGLAVGAGVDVGVGVAVSVGVGVGP